LLSSTTDDEDGSDEEVAQVARRASEAHLYGPMYNLLSSIASNQSVGAAPRELVNFFGDAYVLPELAPGSAVKKEKGANSSGSSSSSGSAQKKKQVLVEEDGDEAAEQSLGKKRKIASTSAAAAGASNLPVQVEGKSVDSVPPECFVLPRPLHLGRKVGPLQFTSIATDEVMQSDAIVVKSVRILVRNFSEKYIDIGSWQLQCVNDCAVVRFVLPPAVYMAPGEYVLITDTTLDDNAAGGAGGARGGSAASFKRSRANSNGRGGNSSSSSSAVGSTSAFNLSLGADDAANFVVEKRFAQESVDAQLATATNTGAAGTANTAEEVVPLCTVNIPGLRRHFATAPMLAVYLLAPAVCRFGAAASSSSSAATNVVDLTGDGAAPVSSQMRAVCSVEISSRQAEEGLSAPAVDFEFKEEAVGGFASELRFSSTAAGGAGAASMSAALVPKSETEAVSAGCSIM
jgi:hypothetical protein